MKFGVAIFPTEDAQTPAEIARMAEERGFESLLFPEHTHIPASRETPYPAGGELPPEYSRTYDPFVALTAAAAATERLLIGTGICLVIERDPIITAKEVASLDVLSGGRFLFGVGAGWNVEEMAQPRHRRLAARFGVMRERIEAMKAIWTAGRGELLGPVRRLRADLVLAEAGAEAAPADPRRRQRPEGDRPRARLRRRVDAEPDRRRRRDDRADRRAAGPRGRGGPGPIPVTVVGMMPDPERIERLSQAGVHRVVFWLPPQGRDEVESSFDSFAAVARDYAGAA